MKRNMSQRAVVHFICAFGVFCKGLTALVQTQRTVVATVGQGAHFNCQLLESKDVLQVTWQKILPEGEVNLATYNKYFGPRVNPEFRDKVEFEDAGLQNCSIVIKELMEQDEGCYHCLFVTYPDGSFIGKTCLQLYELYEPVLYVSNSSEETVVSCSATGRPAPTVTLSALQGDLHFSSFSSVSVANSNGTVTVTTTAVLSAFHDNSAQVGCAARVLSAPQIEVFLMIPQVKESEREADDIAEISGSNNSDLTFYSLKPKTQDRDLEMNEMPQTTIKDTPETEAS